MVITFSAQSVLQPKSFTCTSLIIWERWWILTLYPTLAEDGMLWYYMRAHFSNIFHQKRSKASPTLYHLYRIYENWMDITFVTESILITSSVSKVVQSTLCTFISYYNIKTNPKDISNILQRKDVLIVLCVINIISNSWIWVHSSIFW